VEKWCYGYEELKEHCKKHTPEWAERITGVPAKQICDVAREICKDKGGAD
jgi:thiosulfate reductase/polysulfide reductase chain A